MADDEPDDWFTRHTKQGRKAPPMTWGPGTNRRGDAPLFGPPEPLTGDPTNWGAPSASAVPPGQKALNETTGERWISDGTTWSRLGVQTAPTGEPGESGGLPVPPPPTRFPTAPYAGPAFTLPPLGGLQTAPTGEDTGTSEPYLPAPAEPAPEPGGTPPIREAWYRDPQFAATMPTTFGREPTATEKNTLALGALGGVYGQNLTTMQAAAAEQEAAHAEIAEKQSVGLLERAKAQDWVKARMADYEAGLAAARPEMKPLQAIPKAPDLKVRPWLDPEGKDAISVIAQTLGMIAVGIGGVHYHAPLTAMKYFREAAENWRRDEVDAAASKLKEFEASVTTIRGNNELALKQYEIADKTFAHNLEAKKASVVAALDRLKLHDEAVQAAVAPYEETLKATKDRIDSSGKILTHLEKLADVQAKLQKATGNIPTSMFTLQGELDGLKQGLADPNLDPAERTRMERRATVLEQTKKHYTDYQTQLTRDRLMTTQETKEYGALSARVFQTDHFLGGLNQLKRDFMVLEKKGLLRAGRTKGEEWKAWIKQQIPMSWDPESRAAAQRIENFWPDFVVGQARTFWNDIGVRTKDAFGPLKGAMIDFDSAMGFLNGAGDRIIDFRTKGNIKLRALEKKLSGQEAVETTAAPYRLEGSVTEEPDEGE